MTRVSVAAAEVAAEEGVDDDDVVAAVAVAAVLAVVHGAGAVQMVLASWSVLCSFGAVFSVPEMRPGLSDQRNSQTCGSSTTSTRNHSPS